MSRPLALFLLRGDLGSVVERETLQRLRWLLLFWTISVYLYAITVLTRRWLFLVVVVLAGTVGYLHHNSLVYQQESPYYPQ